VLCFDPKSLSSFLEKPKKVWASQLRLSFWTISDARTFLGFSKKLTSSLAQNNNSTKNHSH
jgi:hypothetical protein